MRRSIISVAIAGLTLTFAHSAANAADTHVDDQMIPVVGALPTDQPPSAVEYDAVADLDATTDSTTVTSATSMTDGTVYARATTSGYTCVKKTTQSSALHAYTPLHIDYSSTSWEIHYIDHIYSMNNARYVSGGYTTQLEQCVIGGSRNKHSYQRMANTESEISIGASNNMLVGYRWGTAVDQGTVSSALDFNVGAGKATNISGSLPVSTGGHEAGSLGSGLCGPVGPNSGNEVNGAWNYTYPGYGTNDFKGNVSHGLYEWPVANKTAFTVHFSSCRRARY